LKTISEIVLLIDKFNSLNLLDVLDFEKFNQYAITHHSTTIEGSTLTEVETRLLLDEGITPAGKPLLHSLMVQDHFKALQFIITEAKVKRKLSSDFICELNAQVMKNTGSIYNTIFGEIDATKGMFRKGNVSAGNSYFVNYDKVEKLVAELSSKINNKIENKNSIEDKLHLSFDAHFELVSIHPFYDGNGRTSRLLMNFLQVFFNLPLAIVFKEDKANYFEALQNTRKTDDINIFRGFMYTQYEKYLNIEIEKYEQGIKGKGKSEYGFLI
jgi:Fic family protein